MALISDLVAAISEVEGIPEATVALLARYTREAGHLSQGARGRNAPRATVRDVANLLIAVNASNCIVKDAPKCVSVYRQLLLHHGPAIEPPPQLAFLGLRRNGAFGYVLENIIEGFIGGELPRFLKAEAGKTLLLERYEANARSCDSTHKLLEAGVVGFELAFQRPFPRAELTVDRTSGSLERELIAGASFIVNIDDFMAGRIPPARGDRIDRTTIGFRTFSKIGAVMQ